MTLQLKEPRNVKGMIDLMEHLSEVCVVNGIQNERQLGEFLVENELLMFHFQMKFCHIWITQKSAGTYTQTHQGKLIQGAYVEDTSTDNVKSIQPRIKREENDQSDDL